MPLEHSEPWDRELAPDGIPQQLEQQPQLAQTVFQTYQTVEKHVSLSSVCPETFKHQA